MEHVQTEFKALALTAIAPSLTNPRKTFNPDKLQELANSIAASGVHQPILVRPLPGNRHEDTFRDRQPGDPLPTFELVAGERRYRASKLAGAETIPAIVRALTDDQVLEIQIIENLQRDDLTALEEAEGYQALCDATGIDKEEIGTKIGKSRSYVYARLKLLDLCQDARTALREGQFDTSKALLIARIPDEKLQLKALKAFTEKGYDDEPRLSYRAAKQWVSQNVMLRLEHAVFDIKDAKLCGDKPACADCQLRTGANPDLFSDVDSPDVCTDPPCFHAKEQAHHDQVVAKARKSGMEVIEGEEAEKLMPSRHYIDDYTKVEQHVHDPRTGGQTPLHMLLDELLPKAEVKAATKLIICPHTHAAIKVVPDEVVEKVNDLLDKAAAKSKTASKEDKARAKERLQEDEDRKRHELQKKYEKEWRTRLMDQLKPALLAGAVQAFEPAVLRAIFHSITDDAYYGDEAALITALDLPDGESIDEEDIEGRIDNLPAEELGPRICIFLAARDASAREIWNGDKRVIDEAPTLASLATSAGIDATAIQAEVQDEMRAELEPPAARATADSAAKPKKAKATKPAKPSKMSAEQAQQGIAAAMQGIEAASSGAAGGDVDEEIDEGAEA
jgi:ParB/RepB/Spo0J family partition protein